MRFQPIKQINAIIRQEYFEPTISWALRVVFALNVPLLLVPIYTGFNIEIVWMAFTAYLLSLLDFRGPHYQKVFILSAESILIIFTAIVGMNVSGNIWLAVLCMFVVGMLAALVRNWSDYGAAIGVAMGFFYLFGLSNPASITASLHIAVWMLFGALWALFITLVSFPFQSANPIKRSVANIWKVNTELLDAIINQNLAEQPNVSLIIEKEILVRTTINKSIELFKRRTNSANKFRAYHYDIMIELRKASSLFGASITSLYKELDALNGDAFKTIKSSVIHKTLLSFANASARIAIVVFTNRIEDISIAKIRVKRCLIATEILKKSCKELTLTEAEKQVVNHIIETFEVAHGYLESAVSLLEQKQNLKKNIYLEEYKLTFNNFLSGLNPFEWFLNIRTIFNVNSQQFKYALRVSIALSIGVFAFMFFNINHGYWIPLTIIIVIQPYYGATLKKGIERVIGTVAGILFGGLITLFHLPHYVYILLLVFVSFSLVYFIRHNYKVGVFFLTLMMVILLNLTAQATWQLIAWRVLSTCIGAFLAVLAGYVFWPVWEKQRFPVLMSAALKKNKNYLLEILSYLENDLPKNETWTRQRNLAEAANSDVFACVQRMKEEPSHIHQNVDTSFHIVGINFRITREITSIALSLARLPKSSVIAGLSDYQNNINLIFDALIKNISEKNKSEYIEIDFKKLNTRLVIKEETLNKGQQFIKSELENIYFELEAMCMVMNGNEENIEN